MKRLLLGTRERFERRRYVNRRTVKRFVCCLAVIIACRDTGISGTPMDPRILTFEKFNRAQTYDEIKPLVSGLLARQLAEMGARPEEMRRILKSLQFSSYEPRIVEINDNTAFLVLEHATSAVQKDKRDAFLLSRRTGEWKLENRVDPRAVVKSLVAQQFSPQESNQVSSCTVTGTGLDPGFNGKQWDLKSAVAFRTKEEIEIDLFPFSLKEADLEYWRFLSGLPVDPAAFQSASVNSFHPECRIIFGLDQDGEITFANVGFNNPQTNFSAVWQGPGWAAMHFQPTTAKGLPPEFRKLEITHDRIKLQTTGELQAGRTIRWNSDIEIPLWEKGL